MLAVVVTWLPCLAGVAAGAVGIVSSTLSDVTVAVQPDEILVHLKTAAPAKYRVALIDAPYRLVVDLEDTVYGWRHGPLTVAREPVKQIRGSQFRTGIARVVVEFTRNAKYAIRERPDGLAITIPVERGGNPEIQTRGARRERGALEPTAIRRGGAIERDAAATTPAGPGPPTQPAGLTVSQEGQLSARVTDAPLARVLEAIGEKTGVRFRIDTPLTRAVTADFADLPLDQGIQRLLRNENYAFVYRRGPNDVRLEEVWVFPPGVAMVKRPVIAPPPVLPPRPVLPPPPAMASPPRVAR